MNMKIVKHLSESSKAHFQIFYACRKGLFKCSIQILVCIICGMYLNSCGDDEPNISETSSDNHENTGNHDSTGDYENNGNDQIQDGGKITTGSFEHSEPMFVTLYGEVKNVSESAEVGFYLGFSPKFERDSYRTISLTGKHGKFSITTNGVYGEQKYYYRAYVRDNGKEFLGSVKTFTSKPIEYSINGRTFKAIIIKDGPYGDFCMLQTECPSDEIIKFGDNIFGPINTNGDGQMTAYESRSFMGTLISYTGLPWRLATTSEWQFAAKGASKSKGYKYSGSDNLDDVAWYEGNSKARMHEVATKIPNEIGLYDMCGNYSEPTNDGQAEYFPRHIYVNYQIQSLAMIGNAYGGNFNSSASDCAINSYIKTEKKTDIYDPGLIGLRLVFSIDPAYNQKEYIKVY